jgi:hypothetical protein
MVPDSENDLPGVGVDLGHSLRSGRSLNRRRAFGAPASSLRSRGGRLFARALLALVVTFVVTFQRKRHPRHGEMARHAR